MGEITNLEIPVDFSKKFVLNPHLFSGIAQFTDNKPISDEIFAELDEPFFTSSLRHELFIQPFCQFPYQKVMVL